MKDGVPLWMISPWSGSRFQHLLESKDLLGAKQVRALVYTAPQANRRPLITRETKLVFLLHWGPLKSDLPARSSTVGGRVLSACVRVSCCFPKSFLSRFATSYPALFYTEAGRSEWPLLWGGRNRSGKIVGLQLQQHDTVPCALFSSTESDELLPWRDLLQAVKASSREVVISVTSRAWKATAISHAPSLHLLPSSPGDKQQ